MPGSAGLCWGFSPLYKALLFTPLLRGFTTSPRPLPDVLTQLETLKRQTAKAVRALERKTQERVKGRRRKRRSYCRAENGKNGEPGRSAPPCSSPVRGCTVLNA